MINSLDIRRHNMQPHIDIEKEIEVKRNGLYTVTLRVSNGNIVDCNTMEYVNISDYLALKRVVIQEVIVKHGG